jgi:hypothetical protein
MRDLLNTDLVSLAAAMHTPFLIAFLVFAAALAIFQPRRNKRP